MQIPTVSDTSSHAELKHCWPCAGAVKCLMDTTRCAMWYVVVCCTTCNCARLRQSFWSLEV